MPELIAPAGVVILGIAYGVGVVRTSAHAGGGARRAGTHAGGGARRLSERRAGSFAAGGVVLLFAVAPPLASAAHHGLVAHMVQHVLLLAVAPPLLVLGAPGPVVLRALPERRRRALVTLRRRLQTLRRHLRHDRRAVGDRPRGGRSPGARWLRWTAAGAVLQTAVVWAWHVPVAFEGALRHPALHAAEHAGFLATASVFWWAVLGAGRRARHGQAVLAMFVAGLPATMLGVGMTLARTPWYSTYVGTSRAAAVEAQEVAGVVMWSFGGLAYVLAGVLLFAAWVAGADRRSPSRGVVPVEG